MSTLLHQHAGGPWPARRLARALKLVLAMASVFSLSACSAFNSGFLVSPAGPIARMERHEAIIVGIVLLFVLAPVIVLAPLVFWHYRITNSKAAFRPDWGFSWILEVLIWIPPTGIVALLAVFLIGYTIRLDPYRSLASNGAPELKIEVVSLDWKWLFLYPAQHVALVNRLVIPVGEPVHFYLTSGTVMQSLLMPRLAGQIFMMDGMTTQLNFEASKAGDYFGENTQYNGDGFPEDKFGIQAVPPAQFAAWVAKAQANPAKLDDHEYQVLSRESVVPKWLEFGQFEPDLFKRILAQQIPPGYLTQHHENASGQHYGDSNG